MSASAPLGSDFATYLAARRPLIETYLSDTFPHAERGVAQADDLERFLYEPLVRFTSAGGKRTRPALALLGCEAVGGTPEQALSVAAAVEEFQSAALIHDDIADGSELRRGEPCLHIAEGVGPAINVGDLGLICSSQLVLGDPSLDGETKLRLIDELCQMERHTLEGQALDLAWVRDQRWDISGDDYRYMAIHKTAYYSAADPLAMGAVCGGAAHGQVEALRAFGLAAGLAFQLQDDLLNLVGDAAKQGKDYRSDITEGKRTLVAVTTLERLSGARHDELVGLLSSGTTDEGDLERAVSLMEEAGAIEAVRQEARQLASEAKDRLSSADFLPEACQTLSSMADFFVERLD